MKRKSWGTLVAILGILVVAFLIGWAASRGGRTILGIPALIALYGMVFGIQWLVFVPSFLWNSERFFDITGSLTYVSVTAVALALGGLPDGRSILLLVLIMVWAGRLGVFLLQRVLRSGKDVRFDEIKTSFSRLLLAWTLQALWISLTSAAAWTAITTAVRQPLATAAIVGLALWLIGFGIEATADAQKRRFRSDPANQGHFIDRGLWRWSRHPNYFGEILLWIGVATIAAPVLRGWQWITIISPVFVTLLLTRISGIPMLEKRADETWGGQDNYETYKRNTSVLIPRPPKRRKP